MYKPWTEKHILHEAALHESTPCSYQHAFLHQAWLYAFIRIHDLLFLFKPECIPKVQDFGVGILDLDFRTDNSIIREIYYGIVRVQGVWGLGLRT